MLKPILILQYLWATLGLLYNAISFIRIDNGGAALAPTDPYAGAIFIGICILIFSIGFTRHLKIYATLIAVLACLLSYSGLFLHVAAYLSDPALPDYASGLSWAVAVAINSFGVVVLVLGGAAAWRTRQ